MSPDPSIPPLRDLPPGRLETHHAHLLREIGRRRRWRLRLPSVTWTSPRVALVAGASAAAAAAIAVAGGGTPSGHVASLDLSPRLSYAFHVEPARMDKNIASDYLPAPGDARFTRQRGARVPRAVYVLARFQAATNEDRSPTAMQWVKTTRQLAVSSQSRDRVDSPRRPVYFVVMHGHFVDKNAYCQCVGAKGSAAGAPTGTVLSFTIDGRSGQVLDFALSNRSPDFSKLGRTHRFTFGQGRGRK